MRIDTSGNVGIGISSPTAKLDISGPVQIAAGGSQYSVIIAGSGYSSGLNFYRAGYNNWFLGSTNNSGNFGIGETLTAPSMTFLAGGNVGIGTTSPGAKLDVVGSALIRPPVGNDNGFFVTSAATSVNHYIDFQMAPGGGAYNYMRFSFNSQNIITWGGSLSAYANNLNLNSPSGVVVFQTGGTERMRIDSAGKVLIGTTTAGTDSVLTVTDSSSRNYIQSSTTSTTVGAEAGYRFKVSNHEYLMFTDNSSQALRIYDYTNTAFRMSISSAGYVTTPSQPTFYAAKSTATNISSTEVQLVYDTVSFNIGSCYNASNGRFTAPITGVYQFNVITSFTSSNSNTYNAIYPWYNGSSSTYNTARMRGTTVNGVYGGICGSMTISMTAGDYIQMTAYSQFTGVQFNGGEQIFSGFLVG
jgi:hypothetical protein